MSLQTPDSVRRLQRALYAKAKSEPAYRFYLLYDKVHRDDILIHAYRLSRAARGARTPGVDGVTFNVIEAAGREEWLAGLKQTLQDKTYRPDPVRRVLIPKPGGGERPLGIPTIRDRVVQTAVSWCWSRSSKRTSMTVRMAVDRSGALRMLSRPSTRRCATHTRTWSTPTDTIPRQALLQSVARRVVDRHVLHLLKIWLKTPSKSGTTGADGA